MNNRLKTRFGLGHKVLDQTSSAKKLPGISVIVGMQIVGISKVKYQLSNGKVSAWRLKQDIKLSSKKDGPRKASFSDFETGRKAKVCICENLAVIQGGCKCGGL